MIKIVFLILYVRASLNNSCRGQFYLYHWSYAVRHRIVKSHRLIVACRLFHSRQRWSEAVPNARDCVCSLESITRDGQAARKPTRPRTARLIDRHLPLLRDLQSPRHESRDRLSSRGSQPPATRKPGSKTGRKTPGRWISSDTHERTLSRCSFFRAFCTTRLGRLFHSKNIVAGIFIQSFL